MLHIVLHEPEIPFNTGAIGRTCVATHTPLHMIRPYGFTLDDRYIKRAGMDYWATLDLHEYLDYEDFLAQYPELRFADDFEAAKIATSSEFEDVQKTAGAAKEKKESAVKAAAERDEASRLMEDGMYAG